MPRKPQYLEEGDHVALYGKVTRVGEPDVLGKVPVTVRIDGYGVPVTVELEWLERIEPGQEPKVRDLRE